MAWLFRAKWLLLPILIIVIAGGYAAWQYFSKWESTDDAQIEGHIHPVNAKLGGTVLSVSVQENQHVESGTVLVQLDARDYEVAVSQAAAELAGAQAVVLGARAAVPIASSGPKEELK